MSSNWTYPCSLASSLRACVWSGSWLWTHRVCRRSSSQVVAIWDWSSSMASQLSVFSPIGRNTLQWRTWRSSKYSTSSVHSTSTRRSCPTWTSWRRFTCMKFIDMELSRISSNRGNDTAERIWRSTSAAIFWMVLMILQSVLFLWVICMTSIRKSSFSWLRTSLNWLTRSRSSTLSITQQSRVLIEKWPSTFWAELPVSVSPSP